MGKLKPIEQLIGDVKEGDLVRLIIKEKDNEFVGYCCLIEHEEGGKNPYSNSNYHEPESYTYDFRTSLKKAKYVNDFVHAKRFLYLCPEERKAEINLSDPEIKGRDLRVIEYEVLRRRRSKQTMEDLLEKLKKYESYLGRCLKIHRTKAKTDYSSIASEENNIADTYQRAQNKFYDIFPEIDSK